jgi:hypothetical protein
VPRRRPAELDDGDPAVDVWTPGPDGRPVEPEPSPATEDALRRAARTVADHVRDPSSTPGHRPGGFADRAGGPGGPGPRPRSALAPARSSTRTGANGEVLQSLLLRPPEASRLIGGGQLFRPPLPRFHVDESRLSRSGDIFTWPVVVRTGLLARVRATLVIRPSPSANLTVLELSPRRLGWFQTRAFVRTGITAVDRLGARLQQRAGPRSRPGRR